MKKVIGFVVMMVLLWAQVGLACETLGVLGFPESCGRACAFGGHSIYDNVSCLFDILIGW